MIRIRRILVLAAILAVGTMLASCFFPVRSSPGSSAASNSARSSTAGNQAPASRPQATQQQPSHQQPSNQARNVYYERGKVHQVAGIVRAVRGGYQLEDERTDTVFIFVNLSRQDAARFQSMVGKRVAVRINVVSGETTRNVNVRVVGF